MIDKLDRQRSYKPLQISQVVSHTDLLETEHPEQENRKHITYLHYRKSSNYSRPIPGDFGGNAHRGTR